MGLSNWIKKKEKEPSILKDWQLKLMEKNHPNLRKDEFIEKYGIDTLSKMEEGSFKWAMDFHTKFSSNEQCDIWLEKVFEGIYYLDISNADYLAHHLIPDDGDYYLFENKCGRSHFTVYRIEYDSNFIEYDENGDSYKLVDKMDWNKAKYVFSIRLKGLEFIKDFLENLLQKNLEYTKGYKRGLKLNEILK